MNQDAAAGDKSLSEPETGERTENPRDSRQGALYECIIVPLDGSTPSERALPAAVSLAERLDVIVQLVHVIPETESVSPAVEYVEQMARTLGPRARALTPIVTDATAWAIRETVSQTPGALLCMSSHGRGGLERAVLGSVAESVLRETAGPVLLVGPHAHVESKPLWSTVLATFDGSERSEAILPLATRWAAELSMQLILASVIDPRSGSESGGLDVLETNYVKRLAQRVDRLRDQIGSDVLHDHDAAKAIVRYAQDVGASIIAMTTHGRSGLARLTAGSTTMAVVHDAPCPVLVRRSSS